MISSRYGKSPGKKKVGQIAVIGHQDQTRRMIIQPADRVDSFLDSSLFQKRNHRRPAFRIAHRHVIALSICLGTKLRHRLTIHADKPLPDEFLCLAARGNPCAGDDFLQAFLHSSYASEESDSVAGTPSADGADSSSTRGTELPGSSLVTSKEPKA